MEKLAVHKVIKSTSMFKGKVFEAKVEEVILPTGQQAMREVVVHRGGASMLAITDDNKAVLVRQYRHAVPGYTLEVPAGILEQGEDPQHTATRELQEETGYTPSKVEHLLTMYMSMGYVTEKHHIYIAKGLTPGPQNLDEGEDVEVIEIDIDNVIEMIWSGEIVDSKTIAAVLGYRNKIK